MASTDADTDDIILDPQTYDLPDEGEYPARLARIERFEGRDFNTGEPKEKLKLTYALGGEAQGSSVDEIVTPSLNERATLHARWRALTGAAPEGRQLPLALVHLRDERRRGRCLGRADRLDCPAHRDTRMNATARYDWQVPPWEPLMCGSCMATDTHECVRCGNPYCADHLLGARPDGRWLCLDCDADID